VVVVEQWLDGFGLESDEHSDAVGAFGDDSIAILAGVLVAERGAYPCAAYRLAERGAAALLEFGERFTFIGNQNT
jgi:hypothetical protein